VAYPHNQSLSLSHIPGGNIATVYFRPQVAPELEFDTDRPNGFSGHGIQQAPAIGRGISELIIHRRYMTLDLSPLSFDRVLHNTPLLERNVV
jgi:hypothetical protein